MLPGDASMLRKLKLNLNSTEKNAIIAIMKVLMLDASIRKNLSVSYIEVK